VNELPSVEQQNVNSADRYARLVEELSGYIRHLRETPTQGIARRAEFAALVASQLEQILERCHGNSRVRKQPRRQEPEHGTNHR
jgi:hypothetical protein